MIGSFDTELSVLESAKPILAELLYWDIVRKAVHVGPGHRRISSCWGLILKCDLLWSCSWQGIWRAVCGWEGAETPNRHSASLKCHFVCTSTVTADKLGFINRQRHRSKPRFHPLSLIFIQPFFSHTLTNTHYQGDKHSQPRNSRGPPWYNTAWYSFCWRWNGFLTF